MTTPSIIKRPEEHDDVTSLGQIVTRDGEPAWIVQTQAKESLTALIAEARSAGLEPWFFSGSDRGLEPVFVRGTEVSGGLGSEKRYGIRVRRFNAG